MPRVRDLLYRFRPAGAPGAASAAGVPTDRGADLTAELEPVFAELATTERECARIVDEARRDAEQTRAQHATASRDVVTAAREQAEVARAGAGEQARTRSAAESAAAGVAAEHEAAEVATRAAERMPSYVSRVVESVHLLIGDGQPTDVGAGGAP